MTAKVEGLAKLQARFKAMPIKAQVAAHRALNKGADDLVAMQKRFVPIDQGDLRDSIHKEPGRTHLTVDVRAGGALTTKPVRSGATAFYDYALAQEFGTANHPATPFFWPSYRLLRRSIRSRVTREMRKAIRAA